MESRTAFPSNDPGPCPGAQFVKIVWVEPIGGEVPGTVEWCESRRALNLRKSGHATILPEAAETTVPPGLKA